MLGVIPQLSTDLFGLLGLDIEEGGTCDTWHLSLGWKYAARRFLRN